MVVAVSVPELHRTCRPLGLVEGFDLSICNKALGVPGINFIQLQHRLNYVQSCPSYSCISANEQAAHMHDIELPDNIIDDAAIPNSQHVACLPSFESL